MAQHDYVIANASGATVRADINNMALAISSNNSGSSAPSTTYAYLWWLDTSANVLKLRNSANNAWITMPFSIGANNTVDINGGTIDGTNIGASSAGTGAFTTLTANTSITGTLATAAQTNITSVGTLTGFTSTGIDDNADATAITIDSSENVGIGTTSPDSKLHLENSASNAIVQIGFENDAQEWRLGVHGGLSDGFLLYDNTNSASRFFVGTNGNVGIGLTNPATKLQLLHAGECKITLGYSTTQYAQLGRDTSGNYELACYENGANLKFGTSQSNNATTERMRISSTGKTSWSANGVGTVSTQDRDFTFYTEGSTNGVAIHSAANRIIFMGGAGSSGTGSDKGYLQLEDQGTAKVIFNAGGESAVAAGTFYVSGEGTSFAAGSHNGMQFAINGQSVSSRAANNLQTHKSFYNTNGSVGTITTNGSATAYNTSSDYRLKENVVTDWDGTTLLKQLKPSKFNFKADADTIIQGFLAHEVSSIVPEAVVGEKDAVYTAEEAAEDIIAVEGQPKYQQIDHSKLVPLLVKTIQELEARIATLEG